VQNRPVRLNNQVTEVGHVYGIYDIIMTYRVVHKMGYISIESSVNCERTVTIIVIKVKQIRASLCIINSASPLGFFIRYYLYLGARQMWQCLTNEKYRPRNVLFYVTILTIESIPSPFHHHKCAFW